MFITWSWFSSYSVPSFFVAGISNCLFVCFEVEVDCIVYVVLLSKRWNPILFAPKKKKKKFNLIRISNLSQRQVQSCLVDKQNSLLVLIPIFATHFLQARFNQAWLPCGLNSCIILYFIFFKHGPSPCDLLGEIEEVWFGGYGSVPFGPFAWAQPMRATKWARDIGSTSGSWNRSCIQNFHPKIFMFCVTMA